MEEQAVPQPGAEVEQRTSGKAIASLVLGIVGLIILPVICSTLAIIFGVMARNEIDRDPTLTGRGMAIAGLVLGIVGLVAGIIVFAILIS
jgi:Domain of unknown function (DUF4190)